MSRCERPAKITLFEVLEGDGGRRMVELGDFCIEHFHRERARVKAEGRRTGVSVLMGEDKPCRAEVDAAHVEQPRGGTA
jgi:hypothetical protein